MGRELDLLAKYPKGKRDPAARALEKTPEDVAIARRFGREFFDGERRYGYGGYSSSPERWRGVVDDLIATYGQVDSFLDIGCGKGGLVRAMRDRLPKCAVMGVDVSDYAIRCALKEHPGIEFAMQDVRDIPVVSDAFELVVSINTVHNLPRFGCLRALETIERLGTFKFISVDGYRTEEERQRMVDWNLTALTILPPDGWAKMFEESGYSGDWSIWVP